MINKIKKKYNNQLKKKLLKRRQSNKIIKIKKKIKNKYKINNK